MHRDEKGALTHACSGVGGFDSGMTASDDNHIKRGWIEETHEIIFLDRKG
jgi:hypothetical protein